MDTTTPTGTGDPAATLGEIRERAKAAQEYMQGDPMPPSLDDVPRLLAAIEAVLEQADDLTRKSEALDAEAEYIAGEHPASAAVAVLKRERSIAYDECARWFREAITAALAGKEAGDEET